MLGFALLCYLSSSLNKIIMEIKLEENQCPVLHFTPSDNFHFIQTFLFVLSMYSPVLSLCWKSGKWDLLKCANMHLSTVKTRAIHDCVPLCIFLSRYGQSLSIRHFTDDINSIKFDQISKTFDGNHDSVSQLAVYTHCHIQ